LAERIHTGPSTINDVARLAQVSIKTVSRVMNDEANVREDTRAKVKDAAKQLNYRPNLLARSLAGARSFLIGLLYDNPNPAYVNDLQAGVISRCRQSDYHLLCEPQDSQNPDLGRSITGLLATIRLDGVILTPPLCEMTVVLEAVEAAGVPYVRLSPHIYPNRSAAVRMDEFGAALTMTQHLLAKGHKDIGYVMGHPEHGGSHQRYEGFIRALRDIGKEPRTEWVKQGYFTFDSGLEAARLMFAGTKRPTAVFAANDYMAFGVMAHLQDIGLKVPDDVSVVGFDDAPGCRLVWPHLTTIRQPVFDMAAKAADILLKGAHGTLPTPMVETTAMLDFTLIERASVRDL
jgi:LacI family transcriptional regulator